MSVEDQMAIGPMDGMVVLRFREPMEQVAFPPAMAIEVAESFTSAAFEADTGLKPVSDSLKAELIEKNRKICVKRVERILDTLRSSPRYSNEDVAKQIIDRVFGVVY